MPARHSRRWVQALPSRVLWILLRRQAACLVSPLILHALELVPVARELLPGHGGMQPADHVPPLDLIVFVQAGVAHPNWVRVSVPSCCADAAPCQGPAAPCRESRGSSAQAP